MRMELVSRRKTNGSALENNAMPIIFLAGFLIGIATIMFFKY
jgi:hypothetical protein